MRENFSLAENKDKDQITSNDFCYTMISFPMNPYVRLLVGRSVGSSKRAGSCSYPFIIKMKNLDQNKNEIY